MSLELSIRQAHYNRAVRFPCNGLRIEHLSSKFQRYQEAGPMSDDVPHWSESVTAWHVLIAEKTLGSSPMGKSTNAVQASGIVTKDPKTEGFIGKITGPVFYREDNNAPETIVVEQGSETWDFDLSMDAEAYDFKVGIVPDAGVPEKITVVGTGETRDDTGSVMWILIDHVQGQMPETYGPIHGELHADDGQGVAIWTLTPGGGGSSGKPSGPSPGRSPPQPPVQPPIQPPPRKRDPDKPSALQIHACALEQFALLKGRWQIDPLAFCSVGTHQHFGGMTKFYGTITLHGRPKDTVTSVHLEIVGRGGVATGTLSTAASQQLLRAFPSSGSLSFQRQHHLPALLFEVPSAATNGFVSLTDATVELRVRAETAKGARATFPLGSKPILVEGIRTPRFGPPDEEVGGDGWVLPSVKTMLEHYQMPRGDCSHMNGGPFAPHASHRDGRNVDLFFAGYERFDAACAEHLLSLLDDEQFGYKVVFCWVLPIGRSASEFWRIIDGATLADGRPARIVVQRYPGHSDHLHWQIDPLRPAPRHAPRRPARDRPSDHRGGAQPLPRPQPRGPRRRLQLGYSPPIAAVWELATAPDSSLHIIETCPALDRAREAGSQIVESVVGPEEQDLGALEAASEKPLCGTCLSMYRADVEQSARDGVVSVTHDRAGDALVVYLDRVEYQIGEDRGDAIAVDDLRSVVGRRFFGAETATLVVTGGDLEMKFSCVSVEERNRVIDALADVAPPGVAFSRGGETWTS